MEKQSTATDLFHLFKFHVPWRAGWKAVEHYVLGVILRIIFIHVVTVTITACCNKHASFLLFFDIFRVNLASWLSPWLSFTICSQPVPPLGSGQNFLRKSFYENLDTFWSRHSQTSSIYTCPKQHHLYVHYIKNILVYPSWFFPNRTTTSTVKLLPLYVACPNGTQKML